MHCLVVDLDTRAAAGEELPTMPPWHVQENKWRAARYGLDAITRSGASYQRQREVARRTGGDLVAVVDSVVRELEL